MKRIIFGISLMLAAMTATAQRLRVGDETSGMSGDREFTGYNDNFCSPTSIFGMLGEMKAPKTVAVTYTNQHFSFDESRAQAAKWVMKQIK